MCMFRYDPRLSRAGRVVGSSGVSPADPAASARASELGVSPQGRQG
jgi:hypothetical protein